MIGSIPGLPAPQKLGRKRSFASLRTITALVLREMATSYGRSPGGYIWAIVEPVAGIALLSLIFSLMLRHPPLGTNFQLFYATGILPFTLFTSVSGKIAGAIQYSRPLLAYPSVTFIDAILARFLINMLTQIMVAYLVLGGIVTFLNTGAVVDFPTISLAILLAGSFALGVGTLNCFLVTRFPIWQQAWSILSRPLLIISCVLMVYDTVPRTVREYLWYNPIVHIIGLMRRGFYTSYDAPYANPTYVLSVSGICTVFGILLLRRHQYSLLDRS